MELIDRDALIKRIGEDADVLKHARELIRLLVIEAPAVDAEPVRHGHWIEKHRTVYLDVNRKPVDTSLTLKCSRCGRETERYDTHPVGEYCPRCGAKMDGKDEKDAEN